MKIELTETQLKLLYQLVVKSNWNGQQLEQALELKDLLGKKVEELIDANKIQSE